MQEPRPKWLWCGHLHLTNVSQTWVTPNKVNEGEWRTMTYIMSWAQSAWRQAQSDSPNNTDIWLRAVSVFFKRKATAWWGGAEAANSICVLVWWSWVGDLPGGIRTVTEMYFHSALQMPADMSHCIEFMKLGIPYKWQSLHLVESCHRKTHTAMKTMRRGPSDILKHLRGWELAEGDTQIACDFQTSPACLIIWHSQKSSWNKTGLNVQKYFGSSIQFMASGLLSILHISSIVQNSTMQLGSMPFICYAEMLSPGEHPQ